jgi:uncharacterized protein YcbK (DUF882 family)
MNLSRSFKREEFLCKCGDCDYDTVDAELVTLLQELRDYFNQPIKITSGNRCIEHNLAIGSKAKNSYHIRGRAADIQVSNVLPIDVQAYIRDKYPNRYGLGCYTSFTHIDTRTKKGRWNG